MKLQKGDYIKLEGLTDQQVQTVIDAMVEAGGTFNDERLEDHEYLYLDVNDSEIWFTISHPRELDEEVREVKLEQLFETIDKNSKYNVVKQERYLSEDGKDLIDKWAERYSPEEFRLIMFAMMEKYQERLGKKDSIAKECRKIADYANRLALVEENR